MKTCFEALERRSLFSAPTVTDFHANSSVAAIDVPLLLSTTGLAQSGVRAASWWLDIDSNGQWTPNVDIALGDAWSPTRHQQETLQRVTVPSSSWPQHVRILSNVMDTSGQWGAPRLLQLERTTRPLSNSLSLSAPLVTPDEPLTMTVTGFGATQLAAASFFADMNGNRIWDPGVDQPLGDSWTRIGLNSFRITMPLGWAIGIGLESPNQLGVQSRIIGANVKDVNGVWSSMAATATIIIAPRANVLSLTATGTASNVQLTAVVQQWSAGGWGVVLPGAPNAVTSTVFFYDANRSGRFDAGDVSLGTVAASPNMGSFGGTFTLNALAASLWPFPRQFGAYAIDARISGDPKSAVRVVQQIGDTVSPLNVLPWVTQVRQAPSGVPRVDPWAIEGDPFLLQTTVNSAVGSPIRLASAVAFYDVDRDGQYNIARDQLIGTQPLAGASSEYPTFSFAIAGNGLVHIAVAGIDTAGRVGAARSTVVLVTQRPAASVFSTNMITDGGVRFLEVAVNASCLSGVQSVTGIVLSQNDQRYYPTTGTLQNGRWVLRIPTAGLPTGLQPLAITVTTFYNIQRVINVNAMIT